MDTPEEEQQEHSQEIKSKNLMQCLRALQLQMVDSLLHHKWKVYPWISYQKNLHQGHHTLLNLEVVGCSIQMKNMITLGQVL